MDKIELNQNQIDKNSRWETVDVAVVIAQNVIVNVNKNVHVINVNANVIKNVANVKLVLVNVINFVLIVMIKIKCCQLNLGLELRSH